jgi:hypothetical protein
MYCATLTRYYWVCMSVCSQFLLSSWETQNFKSQLAHSVTAVVVPLESGVGTSIIWGEEVSVCRMKRGVWVMKTHPGRFSPGNDSVPIVKDAGWTSGQEWTDTSNLASSGFWFPDRPARRNHQNWFVIYIPHTKSLLVCMQFWFVNINPDVREACRGEALKLRPLGLVEEF